MGLVFSLRVLFSRVSLQLELFVLASISSIINRFIFCLVVMFEILVLSNCAASCAAGNRALS
jgi:hypothetical protein